MSNYTNENLINVPSSTVPAGTLAMKVGDNIFTAGNVTIETNTSDATATAQDIIAGKTAYIATGKITGIAVPATNFYKCSYVNSNSWGGYKAILIDDHYEFQSNSTTGLLYTGYKPAVGTAYSTDTLIKAKLTFYSPGDSHTIFLLDPETLTDKTGNFIITGDQTFSQFTTQDGQFGQKRLVFPAKGALFLQSEQVTIGDDTDYTVQLWYTRLNSSSYTTYFPVFGPGPNQPMTTGSFQFHTAQYGAGFGMWTTGTDYISLYSGPFANESTHHIAISRRASDGYWKCWVDGVVVYDWQSNQEYGGPGCSNDALSMLYIGNGANGDRYNMAAIQDYRISDILRYDGNFTPPDGPLT